jgi:long-subunit acyl-CoA synthetase (AMP-forming)
MGPVGTIGKPVDCEAMISDGAGGEAHTGTPGELLLRGRNVFAGYWKNPERTAESFTTDGGLKTGDLALKREDGSYEILGRVKTIVMMAGFLIRPEEIDEAMASHPAVSQAVTVGLPHEEFGEIPVTAVVLDPPTPEAGLAAMPATGSNP